MWASHWARQQAAMVLIILATWLSAGLAVCDASETRLVVGGGFSTAGGQNTSYVAVWNAGEAAWSSLEDDVVPGCTVGPDCGVVLALATYRGELYAGGYFRQMSGVNASMLAVFRGGQWNPVKRGLLFPVFGLTVFQDRLIVGGDFAGGLAAWDGVNWAFIDGGADSTVRTFLVQENVLIVGGGFTRIGGYYTNAVAQWDGARWSGFGSGLGNPPYQDMVYALALYDDKLIAGGDFRLMEGAPLTQVAQWDGVSWSQVGGDFDGTVFALAVFDGRLVASGFFQLVSGATAQGVAIWDGVLWKPLGGGRDLVGPVFALAVHGDTNQDLVVGGNFRGAFSNLSNIARWDGANWTDLDEGTNSHVYSLAPFQVSYKSAP